MDTIRALDMLTAELKAIPPRTEGESDDDRAALVAQAKGRVRARIAAIDAAEAAEAARWDAFDLVNAEYLAAADHVDAAIQTLGGAVRDALAACSAAAQAYPAKSIPTLYQIQNLATSILEAMARDLPKEIQIPAADPGGSVGELVRGKASEIQNARSLAIAKAATAADITTDNPPA